MNVFALLFTLAGLGVAETSYLVQKRKAAQHPFCVIGESCSSVLESKYNRIFFIHNDVLGFLFSVAVLIVTGLLVFDGWLVAFWTAILYAMIGSACLLSLVFVYLQWRVIRAWCFWCLLSTGTIFLMGIILLIHHFL